VKILLDECVDWRLARDIVGYDLRLLVPALLVAIEAAAPSFLQFIGTDADRTEQS
jgi:hypothetical protein